jgi:hypothetical protein
VRWRHTLILPPSRRRWQVRFSNGTVLTVNTTGVPGSWVVLNSTQEAVATPLNLTTSTAGGSGGATTSDDASGGLGEARRLWLESRSLPRNQPGLSPWLVG